ncbi:shikimate dehydrogenase [Desulfitibacter alkalitolerans]|uniref:shikimate dehydrogenase n=1 Tax=Desulfitibacter alkalitolerans TaxID=264641 RepID=UPI0004821A5E|nr:shikimate dehydrogenase [Desulfitibacter alkalitolerans]
MKNKINAKTNLIGIIGNPVGHSLSPLIHNHLFELLNLNYVYLAFDVKPELLIDAVHGLTALGAKGFNVTVPHKEKIMGLLDHVEKNAQIIGAVNTVLVENGRIIGYNTDVAGFKKSIEESGFCTAGEVVTVLGAGGAARAAIIGLIELGAREVNIINRNEKRTQDIIDFYRANGIDNIKSIPTMHTDEAVRQSRLIINATSVGMKGYLPNESPISPEYFTAGMWVCDLVYNPLETVFLSEAKKRGCNIINGLHMLVHQGADSFKIWTKIEPPREKVKEFLQKNISYM